MSDLTLLVASGAYACISITAFPLLDVPVEGRVEH
jgi:hypothetical protein